MYNYALFESNRFVNATKSKHIYPKYKVRKANANSVDTDRTPRNTASDQGLHCLPTIKI